MSRPQVSPVVRLAGALAASTLLAAIFSGPSLTGGWRAVGHPPELEPSCRTDNPYLATVCYWELVGLERRESRSSVLAFRDTPGDTPHYELATYDETGTVYGLAFSSQESALYAAAFHKRERAFGPGGPGAIYRIDLDTGDVDLWTQVPNAGPDRHQVNMRACDKRGAPWAGKTSLGDIEIGEDDRSLFVVNLNDRRIYRLEVPSGRPLGDFPHGAASESWSGEARPFGLAVYDGGLLHGVVRSAENSRSRSNLRGYVYWSRYDGSEMREVASFGLDYERGLAKWYKWGVGVSLDWLVWDDRPRDICDYQGQSMHPMPQIADLATDSSGNLIVGLRDRFLDMASTSYCEEGDALGIGAGDIIRGTKTSGGWDVEPIPEHFSDEIGQSAESALGALAAIEWLDVVVTNGVSEFFAGLPGRVHGPAVYWFEAAGGGKTRSEETCRGLAMVPRPSLLRAERVAADDESLGGGSTGDIELLCARPEQPTPSATSTLTPSPTGRATAIPTPTVVGSPSATAAPSPTPSVTVNPTHAPQPVYLPLLLKEDCDPTLERADIALVIDTSSSMTGPKLADAKEAAITFVELIDLAPGRDQVTVVRFDSEADVACELTAEQSRVVEAIRELETRRGTHIDCGLRAALHELQGPRRLPDNTAVMILLTDGRQTGTPGAELEAAAEARAAGVRLYAIGLGADVDAPTLVALAATRDRYYFAPDSSHLRRIYGEVARDIDCPAEEFWGRR